jgi:hypothetical protein
VVVRTGAAITAIALSSSAAPKGLISTRMTGSDLPGWTE